MNIRLKRTFASSFQSSLPEAEYKSQKENFMSVERKTSTIVSTVTGAVLCVLLIPVIIINLILIVGSYRNPDELPGVFGIKPAVVLSGSMEPVIRVGDMIFIHNTDTDLLKEGDVICYLSSGKAITHRIAGVTAGEEGEVRYVTRGDANNTEDRLPVTADQIQGIWKGGRIGGLGSMILFMQTTTGMILFIICPLLLFLLWDIWRRRRADQEEASHTAQLEAELAALKAECESREGRVP